MGNKTVVLLSEPVRPAYDYARVKFGTCNDCGLRARTHPHGDTMICGVCADADYLSQWQDYARQLHGLLVAQSAPAAVPSDAAITACALMIYTVCQTKPKEEWRENFEKRIRWMLFKDSSDPTPAHTEATADLNVTLRNTADALDASGMHESARVVRGMQPGYPPAHTEAVAPHTDESPKEMMERLTREWNALSPFEQEIRRRVAAPTAAVAQDAAVGAQDVLANAPPSALGSEWIAGLIERLERHSDDDRNTAFARSTMAELLEALKGFHLVAAPHPRASDAQQESGGWKPELLTGPSQNVCWTQDMVPRDERIEAVVIPAADYERVLAMLAASPAAPLTADKNKD